MSEYKRVCEYCSSVFFLNPRTGLGWIKKTNGGRFCSHKCYTNNRKGVRVSPETEFKKGASRWGEHINFKTGIWAYRKFNKGYCEDCATKEDLQVHHLDKNRENNDPENLRTLCRGCHWGYHRGQRSPAWNKGKRMPSLTPEHKAKISRGLRRYYATN